MKLMDHGTGPIDFQKANAAARKVAAGTSRRGFGMTSLASPAGIGAFVKQNTVARMRSLITKGGSGPEIVVYPNVDRGFNADYRPSSASYAQNLGGDWFEKDRV